MDKEKFINCLKYMCETEDDYWCEKIANYLIDNDIIPVVTCDKCIWGSGNGYFCSIGRGIYFDGNGTVPKDFCSSGELKK